MQTGLEGGGGGGGGGRAEGKRRNRGNLNVREIGNAGNQIFEGVQRGGENNERKR